MPVDVKSEATIEYQIIPFMPLPARREQVNEILRKIAAHETIFSDYAKGCDKIDEGCFCERCDFRIRNVASMLTKPDAVVWEVWKHTTDVDEEATLKTELAGIMYLTDINPGGDATAHYVFFDSNLQNKTETLRDMIQWVFEDHEDIGWYGLMRLTVEIPDCFAALAAHAVKRLGFGGDFEYGLKNRHGKVTRTIPVEGVKRNAIVWRDTPRDLLVLGLTRDEAFA